MKFIIVIPFLTVLIGVSSCASNDELEKRLEKRNDSYSNVQDRRKMRTDARQERTDAWYDRVMH